MHIVDDVLGGSGGLEAKEADFGLKGLRFESTICQVITELLWAPFPHTAPQAPKRKKRCFSVCLTFIGVKCYEFVESVYQCPYNKHQRSDFGKALH